MNLKDQIAADVATFLNSDEFAEMHIVDGKSVECVLDIDEEGKAEGDIHDGVFVEIKTLAVRESDLAKMPVRNKAMMIDGESYLCLSWAREVGMLVIKLAVTEAV